MKVLITSVREMCKKHYSNDDVKEIKTIEDILSIPYERARVGRFRFPGYIVLPKESSVNITEHNVDADAEIIIYDDFLE